MGRHLRARDVIRSLPLHADEFRDSTIPMKKIALLALAFALAGGTFLVATKQSCGTCCAEVVQPSTTSSPSEQGRIATAAQK